MHATNDLSAARWADCFDKTLESPAREHPTAPVIRSVGLADTTEAATLTDVAVRARRRMEVIQKARRQRRAAEGGREPAGFHVVYRLNSWGIRGVSCPSPWRG
jgi:hypothetical protein